MDNPRPFNVACLDPALREFDRELAGLDNFSDADHHLHDGSRNNFNEPLHDQSYSSNNSMPDIPDEYQGVSIQILYLGKVYQATIITTEDVNQHANIPHGTVEVVEMMPEHDRYWDALEEDNGEVVLPEYLVFECRLYVQIFADQNNAALYDEIPRVTWNEVGPENFVGEETEHGANQVLNQVPNRVTNRRRTKPQSRLNPAINRPRTVPRNRARVTNGHPQKEDELVLGFDVPPEERLGLKFEEVTMHNVEPGPIRSRWAEVHLNYLFELMEKALLEVNRPLEYRDFPAITEALHRKFVRSGLSATYRKRGFHVVHCHVFKQRLVRYEALESRILSA